jgi:phosphoglycolate phosphatase
MECVLFDLDGTFADTAPDLVNALNRTLREQGRAPLPLEQIRPYVSHGGAAMIRAAFGSCQEEHRQQLLHFYRQEICQQTRLFPGMAALVDALEERAIPWGIVTNKPAWLTEPLMQGLGYRQRAGCIVSGDTLKVSKPHPEPILHACQLVDRDPKRTIYLGDAQRDMEAGRLAGNLTLAALFGYIGENDRPEKWDADGAIHHPEELLDWL